MELIMRNSSEFSLAHYAGAHRSEQPKDNPSKSGCYLTTNDRGQTWWKYFDATNQMWAMSWAEFKDNTELKTPIIGGVEIAQHVLSWKAAPKTLALRQYEERCDQH
jgi:hypothetical protein